LVGRSAWGAVGETAGKPRWREHGVGFLSKVGEAGWQEAVGRAVEPAMAVTEGGGRG
jgi:hypothetical protein